MNSRIKYLLKINPEVIVELLNFRGSHRNKTKKGNSKKNILFKNCAVNNCVNFKYIIRALPILAEGEITTVK